MNLVSEVERFWERVNVNGPPPSNPFRPVEGGCWLWLAGTTNGGYGTFSPRDGVTFLAHRYAYELLVGPIPRRRVLDHLCRVHDCLNPAHLEPVSNRKNAQRGIKGALTTKCSKSHPYTRGNTYIHRGKRYCRTCNRDRQRVRRESRRAA